jgi:hypothetical protein
MVFRTATLAQSDFLFRCYSDPTIAPDRLRQVLCWREQRHVGQQLTLSYERKRIMLEETELTRGLVGQYVDTYAFADGRLEVRWKGVALSYRAFDKDQRVSQADIVENKRLSAVLAQVKEMQESRPPPRVKTNSEKNGYRKTGRRKPNSGPAEGACAAD